MVSSINLSEIENLDEIRKSSRWVNAEFKSQGGNREAKHFTYNFMTKNTGEELNFSIRLIEDKNRNIEFQTREKKIPIVEFMTRFLAGRGNNILRKFLSSSKKTLEIFSYPFKRRI